MVPAWNEEGDVSNTVHDIRAGLPGIGVLAVDDGSTDRTGKAADEAGAMVLRLARDLGGGVSR